MRCCTRGFEQYKDNAPLDSASRLGDILKELLLNLQSKHPQIAEVRGRGAMFGAEFSGNHAGEMVSRVITRAAELGVIFILRRRGECCEVSS